MPSFDVSAEINWQNLDDAINQTLREVQTRFDFKNIKTEIKLNQKERNLVIQYKLSGGDVEVREHIKSMLLDEPADLLDQRNKREFIEWVKERFNCQIIIATHDKNMVDIGDKVISQN